MPIGDSVHSENTTYLHTIWAGCGGVTMGAIAPRPGVEGGPKKKIKRYDACSFKVGHVL